MIQGKGDVLQLTGNFVRLARRVVKKLKRHDLETDKINYQRIESQIAEVKRILSCEGVEDNVTEKSTSVVDILHSILTVI